MLTSPGLEGRETGQRGQRMAADSLARKYISLGIDPLTKPFGHETLSPDDYKQRHPMRPWVNKGRNLSVNGDNFLFGRDFVYYQPQSDTAIFINKILFFANKGFDRGKRLSTLLMTDRYTTKNLLIFDSSEDIPDILVELNSKSIKPASVFIISPVETIARFFMNEKRFTDKALPGNLSSLGFPVFFITDTIASQLINSTDYEKLKRKAERKKNKDFVKEFTCDASVGMVRDPSVLRGENVMACIKGYDSGGETIIISSHYDHLGKTDSVYFPGADDNGSGTSAVIELARVFKLAEQSGLKPKRNIIFLNVSGEEKGLFGSSWFVDHPPVPLTDIVTDLNIDMIGRTDSIHDSAGIKNYVYMIGTDKLSTELNRINEEQNYKYTHLDLDYKYNSDDDPNHFYRRSDHYSFAKKGIPVAFYFEGKHADYHLPSDTPDKIDLQLLTLRARLVFLTAWELANRERRIVVDKK